MSPPDVTLLCVLCFMLGMGAMYALLKGTQL